MSPDRRWTLALPAALLLLAIYAWPLAGLFRMAFQSTTASGGLIWDTWSLDPWRALLSDAFTVELTLNSLRLSLISTTLALLLAYPVALFLYRTTSRWRGLLAVIAVAPMLVSGVVRVFGWLAILGDRGLVNTVLQGLGLVTAPLRLVYNFTGVAIGLAEALIPYMIMALLAGFGRLDRSLEEAAASLGAPPRHVFWRVTLPLSLPAVALGFLLCFVLAMSAFVTPKLLGGGRVFVLATEIYDSAITNANWPAAAALAFYTLVLLTLLLGSYSALARRAET
jgi:putative spermidine/putrescine transport system permease protein